jgi:hypothetical protein
MHVSRLPAVCAALSVFLLPVASGAEAVDPDAVLRDAGTALGASHMRAIAGFHAHQKIAGVGLTGTGDAWARRSPMAAAEYTKLGPLVQDQGFDGKTAWSRDGKGVVWVEGNAEGRSAALNDAFRTSYALYGPAHGGARVAALADTADKGVTYHVVRVAVPGSIVPFDEWIDAATHLPARYVETSGGTTTTTELTDYRAVRGVRIPFAEHQSTSQGNDVTMTTVSVAVDPPELDAHLRKPASTVRDFTIEGGSATTVPIRLVDDHVYVDVMLNGKGPYHFIFDTGGSNIIDPAVAKEIGTSSAGSIQGGGVGASTETFQFANVKSLAVGNARLADKLFAVVPVRAGFGMGASEPVDGLIGFEVLARFVTVFDYEHRTLELRMPGNAPPSGRAVPFVFTGTQPQLDCTIDGIATVCSVDTGARSSIDLFGPFVATHPTVLPANATASGVDGFGVGGSSSGQLGRLRSLQIGGYDLRDLVAGYATAAQGGAFSTPTVAANIGGGVWRRFVLGFDYAHQTMYLDPNASFAERDSYERAGAFVINKAGAVVVIDVRPGTPAAEAGLLKGDVVTSLDGVTGPQLNIAGVRGAFRRPAGTALHLTVTRKDSAAPVDVNLMLRDFV